MADAIRLVCDDTLSDEEREEIADEIRGIGLCCRGVYDLLAIYDAKTRRYVELKTTLANMRSTEEGTILFLQLLMKPKNVMARRINEILNVKLRIAQVW